MLRFEVQLWHLRTESIVYLKNHSSYGIIARGGWSLLTDMLDVEAVVE
jgi:hypothetical protein